MSAAMAQLADLVAHRKTTFPSSSEINFTFEDPKAAIARVRAAFEPQAIAIDEMDGFGFDLGDWRFNLRSSNTEPVVRLNVEARGDVNLVVEGVERVKSLLLGESPVFPSSGIEHFMNIITKSLA